MRACVRSSDLIAFAAALSLGAAAFAAPPERVVSVNLCTDQLALMLGAPDQIVSVSKLGQDPDSSAMADAAQALPTNGSGAEEVFLLSPDLVLAGTYTAAPTVQMLRNLGMQVELFAPAQSLDDIPANIARMGQLLGRETQADALIAQFHADLADLTDANTDRPRAALWYVNNYTLGDMTLAGDILRTSGFDNITAEIGMDYGGTLPLEQLVMLNPDVIIRGRQYPGQAKAEESLTHPAIVKLDDARIQGTLTDRDWICGTPHVLDAVRRLRDLRLSLKETG